MGLALRVLLEFLGLKILDKAITAFINKGLDAITDLIPGDDDPDDPVTPSEKLPSTYKNLFFGKNTVVRTYLDLIVIEICSRRKNILLSRSDILFSLNSVYKRHSLNEMLYDEIASDNITMTEVNNEKITGYSDSAINKLISMFGSIYKTNLEANLTDLLEQVPLTGLPHRVLISIDFIYRSASDGFIDHVVAIPPVADHIIYTQQNQRDIFGNQLIYGKLAVIKFKDNTSDVYTYGLVAPYPARFDYTINYNWFLTDENIIKFVEKLGVIRNSSDLMLKEIPFEYLETLIKRVY